MTGFQIIFILGISLISTVLGLSVAAKTDFKDADSESSGSETKSGDYLIIEGRNRTKNRIREYIPVVLKRSDRRIEARIPIIITKSKTTERTVPIIRGAAVAKRSELREPLALEGIDGLHPPSKLAVDRWYENQENYYPNVNGPYTTTPRPVYGVPNPSQPPTWNNCPSWGSSAGGGGGGSYPPSGNYPSQGYTPNGGYQPPNQYPMNNYPGNQGGYPSNQQPPHQGGYPSNQQPSHQGGYPSGQQPPYQGGYPPSSNSWGGNNGNAGNPSWQNSNWGSQQSQGWSSRQSGRWVPCGPIDLNGQAGGSPGCTQISSQVSKPIRFEPPPSPASKIDDKTQFNQIPDDVEEISP